MLIAIGENILEKSLVVDQIRHLQQMAVGARGVRYGDLTSDEDYPLDEIVRHGDSFGGYIKSSIEYYNLFGRPIYESSRRELERELLDDAQVSFWFARFRTQGSLDLSNSQPFNLKNIVGSHNGTVYGLSDGGKSDSRCILESIDLYFDDKKSFDVDDFEDTLIEQIADKAEGYSGLLLNIYVKSLDKVLVLCEYNEAGVPSTAREHVYHSYYTPVISVDGEHIYISSESGDVIDGDVRCVENHTLYVIDRKTGEITEYKLEQLEESLKDAVRSAQEEDSLEEISECSEVEEDSLAEAA
tara:strand:+ start:769 stop:1665 length:897 start_codon:yes stop_codon:yes gene_type:complete